MEDNIQDQEFDLDAILNEFQDEDADLTAELDEDLAALLEGLEDEEHDAGDAGKESSSDPMMDTGRMNALIAEISAAEEEKEEVSPAGDTIRLEMPETSGTEKEKPQPSRGPTRRMEPVEESAPEAPAAEAPARPAYRPILMNPRARLRELKRKLVAGPEKRYYELSGMGTLGLQISMVICLILVAACIVVTTLFSQNLIPESRVKLVIFSQVLVMLLSALLGSGLMIDGIADLFKGRLTIRFLLPITFFACCADAVFCLSELRVPCCAAFSLEILLALVGEYHSRSTEMSQMDTLRKAVRLISMVRVPGFYEGKAGLVRGEGEVEDFMDTYDRPSAPETVQSIYGLISLVLCLGIAVLAFLNHGISLAIQVFSTSLLVAIPASFFISLTRPAHLLERRLHMSGTLLCGWRGVKGLCGKLVFPLRDEDIFPVGASKLNGVKFYGDRSPDEVISYTASLICATDSGLVNVFRQMMASRNCMEHPVENFRDYGSGGIGGEICGEPVLLGNLEFLQDMGVEIPEGTMVNQAIYAAIDGQLCAVFAISYVKMRHAAAGLVSLCGTRKVTTVLTGADFMLTDSLIQSMFGVSTRRMRFPDQDTRRELIRCHPDGETPVLAIVTRDELASYAYAVSGARALRISCILGMLIHILAGVIGMLAMAALAYLGATELLTPTHILLYQLVWLIPGLLITDWTRAV